MEINFSRAWKRIMELAEIREPGLPGWTRRAFTKTYIEGRKVVKRWMEDAGLKVTVDAAANLIGYLPGKEESLPPVLVGSHTDTVMGGGRFDGTLGVIAAIEIAETIRHYSPKRGLLVVDFTAEEPTDFGISTIGSRAFVGNLPKASLMYKDRSARTLAEAIEELGGDPSLISAASRKRGDFYAGLELHIEQGPVLENEGKELGVVTGIVGIRRMQLVVQGREDHAGATPMKDRKDALTAMAEAILSLERICYSIAAQRYPQPLVGTVGKLEVFPNAPNIIPGKVIGWAEVRGLEINTLDDVFRKWKEEIREIELKRGLLMSLEDLSISTPVYTDLSLRSLLREKVNQITPHWMELPSGAGHDMNQIAAIAPVGMLFIPCKEGRSHTPEEWCDPEAVTNGLHALYLTIEDLCKAE